MALPGVGLTGNQAQQSLYSSFTLEDDATKKARNRASNGRNATAKRETEVTPAEMYEAALTDLRAKKIWGSASSPDWTKSTGTEEEKRRSFLKTTGYVLGVQQLKFLKNELSQGRLSADEALKQYGECFQYFLLLLAKAESKQIAGLAQNFILDWNRLCQTGEIYPEGQLADWCVDLIDLSKAKTTRSTGRGRPRRAYSSVGRGYVRGRGRPSGVGVCHVFKETGKCDRPRCYYKHSLV